MFAYWDEVSSVSCLLTHCLKGTKMSSQVYKMFNNYLRECPQKAYFTIQSIRREFRGKGQLIIVHTLKNVTLFLLKFFFLSNI